MKEAIYNKKMLWLTFWNSKNTTITENCRTIACAKLVLLTMKNMHKVHQSLIIQ
jgi:hypothetical protein